MKKLLLCFVTIMLFYAVGCSNGKQTGIANSGNAIAPGKTSATNTMVDQSSSSPRASTVPRQQLNSDDTGIRLKEVLVGNKPILGLPYEKVIKYWGTPKEVKRLTVHFPATTEPYSLYLLCYDGVDIEMYPELEGVPIEKTSSFRFDITGSQYDFEGIKVGMYIGEYYQRYGKRQEYLISSILKDTENKSVPPAIRKILTDVKAPNYYSSYDKAFYVGGALVDEIGNITGAIGFDILIKNDTIERIVYGLPTAS